MNLPDTMQAVEDYYADALDECGAPVCAQLRYVGQTDDELCKCVESDCEGSLRVSYWLLGPSASFPFLTTAVKAASPAGTIWVELRVRVMRCWPQDGTVEQWDTAAAGVAADAWCLAKASHELVCAAPKDLALAGCRDVAGYRVEPKFPAGGCAGNEVTLYCQLSG